MFLISSLITLFKNEKFYNSNRIVNVNMLSNAEKERLNIFLKDFDDKIYGKYLTLPMTLSLFIELLIMIADIIALVRDKDEKNECYGVLYYGILVDVILYGMCVGPIVNWAGKTPKSGYVALYKWMGLFSPIIRFIPNVMYVSFFIQANDECKSKLTSEAKNVYVVVLITISSYFVHAVTKIVDYEFVKEQVEKIDKEAQDVYRLHDVIIVEDNKGYYVPRIHSFVNQPVQIRVQQGFEIEGEPN